MSNCNCFVYRCNSMKLSKIERKSRLVDYFSSFAFLQHTAIHGPNIFLALTYFQYFSSCFFLCVCSSSPFGLFDNSVSSLLFLSALLYRMSYVLCSLSLHFSIFLCFSLFCIAIEIALRAMKVSEIDKSRSKIIHSKLFML